MTVPKCPACGAKFSHDNAKMECKVCGLPDEVREAGPQAVARWKRNPIRRTIDVTEGGLVTATYHTPATSKRQRKLARLTAHRRKSRAFRIKHGRVGVKRG